MYRPMEDLMYSGGLVKYWLCEVDSIIQYIFSDFFWEDYSYSIHDIHSNFRHSVQFFMALLVH